MFLPPWMRWNLLLSWMRWNPSLYEVTFLCISSGKSHSIFSSPCVPSCLFCQSKQAFLNCRFTSVLPLLVPQELPVALRTLSVEPHVDLPPSSLSPQPLPMSSCGSMRLSPLSLVLYLVLCNEQSRDNPRGIEGVSVRSPMEI